MILLLYYLDVIQIRFGKFDKRIIKVSRIQ